MSDKKQQEPTPPTQKKDEEFERAMAVARKVMAKRREALKELAKKMKPHLSEK